MGYSTQFDGQLNFSRDLLVSEVNHLKKYLGKDRRDLGLGDEAVYDGGIYGSYWHHIDYELTDDMDGIKWNENEKDNMFIWRTGLR